MPDSETIALVGMIVLLISSVVGGFAYLNGEIRRARTAGSNEAKQFRMELEAKLDQQYQREMRERNDLRLELRTFIQSLENEVRSLRDHLARRSDMIDTETRVNRSLEKIDRRLDEMNVRVNKITLAVADRMRRGSNDDEAGA